MANQTEIQKANQENKPTYGCFGKILAEKIFKVDKVLCMAATMTDGTSAKACLDKSKESFKTDDAMFALYWYKLAVEKGFRDNEFEKELENIKYPE